MPSTEHVRISVGGQDFDAFKDIAIHAAMNEACRHFHLVVADKWGPSATHNIFTLGAKVTISCDAGLVFTGFVDRRDAHMGPREQVMTIAGRSTGQDAVDSSAVHKTGRFDNKTPLEIAKAIAPQGVQFQALAQLDKVKEYQLIPGATVFREVERLCRDQGKTLMGMADGSIAITDASSMSRGGGQLIEGQNILDGTSHLNACNRMKEYLARGQSYDGHGSDAMQIEGTSKDSGVQRDRKRLIVIDGNTNKDRAKARAKYHRDRHAGDSIRATITTVGWRDDNGSLWEPGSKVYVQSPFLGLQQDMLIESIHYHQSHNTTATFALVDPRAYGGQSGGGGDSGSDWGGY